MNPIAIPCRVCLAAPGTECRFYGSANASDQHHPTRVADAELGVKVLSELGRQMAEEAARLAASPAVIVRPAAEKEQP